ncbi:LLM class flavin-dependent oxidoreductase [Nakamurella leprariae]|uniref:LLM class flavin-dependent oxidoreductase n=1 Tax=Nakamurella leprariae TaxID=2803911 RepID=A0A938YDQ5_9ACTN|nr:LLM class flavin-dependent oxidoreductase [Nakamurella leprariae]MBM9466552.1 LLM class flavin-dependent oxidoreductase [Nakamurella leprariae]
MTDVILQVYPTVGDTDAMARLRPIGRDVAAYTQMLEGLVELVQAADELGYWGITHVEHHLHSEGLELSPAPLMLNLYLGQFTRRLMHGQLGLVLPTHDPIRLAEEIAIVDHMLKGRLFVGMARGYQARWQNIIGQTFQVQSTASDQSEADQRNRVLFNEHYAIMKQAWTDELLTYDGPTYQVPYPRSGIPDWPPTRTTTLPYGAPGEVDEDGTVRAVSVCPKPYTSPHPQLFQAFGASPGTLRWCGEEDVTPTILAGPLETVDLLARMYQEGAASRGRDVPWGQGIGLCRTIHFADSKAELYAAVDRYERPVWHGWYEQFGFMEGARLPGEEGPVPKPGEHLADRLLDSGLLLGGTVDDVKRQLERLLEHIPLDYLVWLFHWGLIPRDEGLRTLELFATEIMPEFGLTAASLEPTA